MSIQPFIAKVFYMVMLSPLLPKQSTGVLLKSALSGKTLNPRWKMTTLNLFNNAIPGITGKLSRWIVTNNHFPWEPIDHQLIAFGSGSAIFKLRWKSGVKVLRIYRKSLGKPTSGMLEMAAEYYRKNYNTVLHWYGGPLDLVLPMEFMVLQGLPLVGPVVASLQPYIQSEKLDIFEDFSDADFVKILEANPFMRDQFIFFAEQTMRQWSEHKICYDIVGRENLVLTKQDGSYRLKILDVGIFKFDLPEHNLRERVAQIEQRIHRLMHLYQLAKVSNRPMQNLAQSSNFKANHANRAADGFDLHGIDSVRLSDASPTDMATVKKQLGSIQSTSPAIQHPQAERMVKPLRQLIPTFTNSAAFRNTIALLDRTGGEQAKLLRVLTYHRVDEPQARPWLDPVLVSASPEVFEAQMKHISANYEPISIFDVLEALDRNDQIILPPRAVLVTFDDAYQDFADHAWPILQRYQIPVTLFVPTAFPDHPERFFWWDRLFHALHTTVKREISTPIGNLTIGTDLERSQANQRLKNYIKSLPNDVASVFVEDLERQLNLSPQANCVLGWDALRKLAKEGVTLASHTQTHPIMNHISLSAMQNEAQGSFFDLQREIGETPPVFAYPSGFHKPEVVSAVRAAGFKLAFTTERGLNILGHTDPLRLKRINVGSRTSLPILRAQLLSWSVHLNRLYSRLDAHM